MPNNRIKSPSPDPILKFAPTDELKVARLAHLNAAKKEIEERLDTEFKKKQYSSVILGLKQTGTEPIEITELVNDDQIPYLSTRSDVGVYRIAFSNTGPLILENVPISTTETEKLITLFYEDAIVGYISVTLSPLDITTRRIEIKTFNNLLVAAEMNTLFAANASDYDFILQEIKILP
jgi:hypothetical protein